MLGVVACVLLVLPVPGLMSARRDAARADAAATQNVVRELSNEPMAALVSDAPLLSTTRVAGDLVEPFWNRRLADAVDQLELALGESACTVIRVDGQVVATAGDPGVFIPASVQKLLTAAAVLDVIGPDERLSTVMFASAVVDGVVQQDLHIVGGGDPMLAEQRYADDYPRQPQLLTSTQRFVDVLAAAGVTRIEGAIVVHDDRYDTVRYVPSWPQRYFEQHNAGPTGALTMNDGFAQWDPERVETDDPALYAGQVIALTLSEAGIGAGGAVRRSSDDDRALLANLVEVGRVESAPVGEIVQQMLRESDNNTAESLLKELGYRADGIGTTEGGAREVIAAIGRQGLDTSGVVVVDGSGLDRGNRVSCGLLAELLEQAGPDSVIGTGLAVAARSGTLAHRFGDSPVAGHMSAKTGLLNNVNGLAGFVTTVDGTTVTFAQLQNGVPLNSREGIELQEALAEELVGFAPGATIDALREQIAALDPA